METLPTWKIAYEIDHGPYEYYDYLLRQAESMDERQAAAFVAAFWCADDEPEDAERFREELLQKGFAYLPGSGRIITALGWGPVSPIIVTVRDGLVVNVTGIPDDVTVEVRDWDNGEDDEDGNPVPTVSEWTGPL